MPKTPIRRKKQVLISRHTYEKMEELDQRRSEAHLHRISWSKLAADAFRQALHEAKQEEPLMAKQKNKGSGEKLPQNQQPQNQQPHNPQEEEYRVDVLVQSLVGYRVMASSAEQAIARFKAGGLEWVDYDEVHNTEIARVHPMSDEKDSGD